MTAHERYMLLVTVPVFILALAFWWLANPMFVIMFFMLVYWIGANMFHRAWSHGQVLPSKWFSRASAILGLFAMVGDPIGYAKTHRWHHAHADTDKDLHAPRHGFWHSFIGWMFKPISIPPFIVRDLLKSEDIRFLQFIAKYQVRIIWSTIAVIAIFSPVLEISLCVSMCMSFLMECITNSIAHSRTSSRNIFILSALSMGSLHADHHDDPRTMKRSDPGFALFWVLEQFRLVKVMR